MIKSIVITHGDLGMSLISTTRKIIGETDGFKVLSNEKVSMKDLVINIETEITAWNDEEIMIFVDFYGGSCWAAAQMIRKDNDNIALISGVNLPMILSFINSRESYKLPELADYLKDASNRGTVIVSRNTASIPNPEKT